MAAIGVLTLEIRVAEARSLKDKRQVVRSIKDRLKARFNVSVAEVAHHDSHQRSEIAVAAVAVDTAGVEVLLRRVEEDSSSQLGADLATTRIEIL